MSKQNKDKTNREEWLSYDPASSGEPSGAGKATPDEWESRALRGRELLGSEAEARDLLGEIDAAIESSYGTDTVRELPPKKDRSLGRWLSIAAGIMLILLAAWWLIPGSGSTETLYAAHFEHLDNDLRPFTMGDDNNTAPDELKESLRPYHAKRYEEAVQTLGTYVESHPDEIPVRLYYGISLLASGEPEQAVTEFRKVQAAAVAQHYKDGADWYSALAELKAGRKAVAQQKLEAMAASDHLYNREARELLAAF